MAEPYTKLLSSCLATSASKTILITVQRDHQDPVFGQVYSLEDDVVSIKKFDLVTKEELSTCFHIALRDIRGVYVNSR